jgi:rubrerythrin
MRREFASGCEDARNETNARLAAAGHEPPGDDLEEWMILAIVAGANPENMSLEQIELNAIAFSRRERMKARIAVESAESAARATAPPNCAEDGRSLSVCVVAKQKDCDASTVRRWCERNGVRKANGKYKITAEQASKFDPRSKQKISQSPPKRQNKQQWECFDCGNIVESIKKPKKCPKCNKDVTFILKPRGQRA